MGDAADDILNSMDLSEDDKKRYKPVKIKFDKHLLGKEIWYTSKPI